MLRLRPDLIGTQVKCPKCDASFTVGQPARAIADPASPDDPYEPEVPLKPSSIFPPNDAPPAGDLIDADSYSPQPIVHEASTVFKQSVEPQDEIELEQTTSLARDVVYEPDWSSAAENLEAEPRHERASASEPDYLELAKARGIVRREAAPYVPRWTFFSGVLSFPWRGPNVGRWAMMAFGLVVAGEFFVPTVMIMQGGYTPGSIALPILSMISAVMLLLSLSFASAFFIAAVQDTADGFRDVQESTLPDWDQWFFSFFSVASLWVISGVIGYPFVFIDELGAAAIPICSLLLFPILMLSAMESGSFLLPYSPAVLRSLARQPLTWLSFYMLSTVLVVGWFAGSAVAFPYSPYLVIAVSAVALATLILVYARLLGRVAWKAAGSPAIRSDPGSADSPVTAQPGRRVKRRRNRHEVPPDLDQAARMLADRRHDAGGQSEG